MVTVLDFFDPEWQLLAVRQKLKMSNPLSWLNVNRPWKALIAVGGAGMIAVLSSKIEFLHNRDVFMLFFGILLFGIGEWINHPPKLIRSFPAFNDPPVQVTNLVQRDPVFLGKAIEAIGVAIFLIAIIRLELTPSPLVTHVTATEPQTAKEYLDRGQARYQKEDIEGAIIDLNKAVELNPNFAEAYYWRSAAWLKKDDLHKAVADYNRAVGLNPKLAEIGKEKETQAEILSKQAFGCFLKGDNDGVIANCNKAIELEPKLADAYYWRSAALLERGDTEGGMRDLNKVIELAPESPTGWAARGEARVKVGDFDAAIADFNEALKVHPNLARAYAGRGEALMKKGDTEAAITDLNKAIELDPAFRRSVEPLLKQASEQWKKP